METIFLAYFLYHFGLQSAPAFEESPDKSSLHVEQQYPDVRSFPVGSSRVPLLHLQLSASCDADVSVDSIRVRHRGLGALTDIESLYLVSNSRRLQRGRLVERDGYADLQVRNLVIPACETVKVTLMADFSQNAAVTGEHWFVVERSSDIQASGTTFVSSPTTQPTLLERPTITGGNSIGTISVSYPSLLRRVRYGSRQAVLRISLETDNVSDQLLNAITFTNNGSASNDNLQRLYLETGANKRVTTIAEALSGDRVRLVFDPPLLMKKSQQRLFTLRADVRAGRSRTIQISIEEPSDIEVSSVRG